jgi:capsule polysaccharide modification protein KpsS
MEPGKRLPKKHLSFSALRSCIEEHINDIPELRQERKGNYKISDCYMSGFALFYLQDPSVLEFQRRFEDQIHMNNLRNVFGINNIPGDAQLRNILDTHSYDALLNIFPDFFRRMQRNKSLDQFQFLDGKYLYSQSSTLAHPELQIKWFSFCF